MHDNCQRSCDTCGDGGGGGGGEEDSEYARGLFYHTGRYFFEKKNSPIAKKPTGRRPRDLPRTQFLTLS